MKKYVQNFWVRFLAILLCSVSLVIAVASGILLAGTVSSSQKEVYKNAEAYIAENYAAYIYDNIYGNDEDDKLSNAEVIEELLENKNFTCYVGRIFGYVSEYEITENKEVLVYTNLQDSSDWDYEFRISDGTYVSYNVESVLDALRERPVIHEYEYTEEAIISEYFFEESTGLFYYKAGTQYFLADYVKVSHNGSYYDYKLKNTASGERVYYNSYYDLTLDTSAYREWDWLELNGYRLVIEIEGQSVSNEIGIVRDDMIQRNRYTGVYHIDSYTNLIIYYPQRAEDVYVMRIKVAEDITNSDDINHDMFLEWKLKSDAFYDNQETYQVVFLFSIIFFFISFALLIFSAKDKKEEIGVWNKLPVGCFSLACFCIELFLGELIYILVNENWYGHTVLAFELAVALLVLGMFAFAFFGFLWLQNIITRFRTGTFIRYSELHYGIRFLKWCWSKWVLIWHKLMSPFRAVAKLARENTKLFTKGLVIMFIISFVECLAINMTRWNYDLLMFLFFIEKVIEVVVASIVLLQMQKLKEGSKRIAAGDLSEPIDTSKMFWEFKTHGENINKVSDGIALAVEERIKSERFKTELITNVSHDIKTPLTSIINYVDLIKKENVQDETLQEYVEVLDRQSARLKKLIEDLMEASKASTGNLTVNMEDCDVEVLLTQLIGEFEEKLTANQLEVVVQKPEYPVIVSADGRHMWRVLDNLLNNACKYSLPGTRVYVSLSQVENEATLIFKNISKAALNIPSEELIERFVRGDSSRNTEGSGLGLSIAQSLTELMKGSMKLEIDGDLFKVTLKFQAIRK